MSEKRKKYDREFREGVVRIVRETGKSIAQVARDLDLTASALSGWVRQACADQSNGRTGLTTAEREELAQLRKENRSLRMERDLLKKFAAFFAKESK